MSNEVQNLKFMERFKHMSVKFRPSSILISALKLGVFIPIPLKVFIKMKGEIYIFLK